MITRMRPGAGLALRILGGCLCSLLLGRLAFPAGGAVFQEQAASTVHEYRVGPKDLLEISVFERPELSQTARVSEDGSITLALLGRVEVSGLSAQEIEKKLSTLLEEKYLKSAHVTIFIKEYQRVAVHGAVGKPGMYELVGETTLLTAISQAGGLTDRAMNELYVYREDKNGNKSTITIDLQDLILNGNQSLNISLQPKDVINVPIDQIVTVYVYGEVKNPGALQFKMSKRLTLLQAIAQAGGTTEWASKTSVLVKRRDRKTFKEIQVRVNLKEVISGKVPDIILQEGDVVIVPESGIF